MTKTVSAYEARTNFGELINLVYYKGIDVVIEKMGKPVAKLTSINKSTEKEIGAEDKIASFAGIWADNEGNKIKANAKKFRKKFKLISD